MNDKYRLYRQMCAVVMVLLVVAQLFHFERMPGALIDMGMPGGEMVNRLVAMMLVSVELAALPYLIGMRVAGRWLSLSRHAVLAVGLVWVLIAAWGAGVGGVFNPPAALFGAAVEITGGWWLLWWSMLWAVLLSLAVYTPEEIAARLGLERKPQK